MTIRARGGPREVVDVEWCVVGGKWWVNGLMGERVVARRGATHRRGAAQLTTFTLGDTRNFGSAIRITYVCNHQQELFLPSATGWREE